MKANFGKRLRLQLTLALILMLVFAALPVRAAQAQAETFPDVIPLPDGFQPEGIVIGRGTNFYVGSIPTGAIFHGDLRTGEGEILVPAQEGRMAIGLAYNQRTDQLFVAGGPTGFGYVYDATTGETIAEIQLTTETTTFVNDVVVTREAAYFTESLRPVLYRVPLLRNGEVPDPPVVEEIPLSGDFEFVPGAFNTNGIDATPNGNRLIIVNTTVGALYWVQPSTGRTVEIDLGGGSVERGDGILLDGKAVFVVQNFFNQIAVIRLDPSLTSGEIVDIITDPNFRIPTTLDEFGRWLYVVNARFDTEPTEETEYEVVRVPKH